ncbi:MAG: oxidoreductase [Rhodospirillaceae bacterium BRH_c57]|nr:MAG: oxidoreductase [Rhodospirillaceae bacterium BRH_c57]
MSLAWVTGASSGIGRALAVRLAGDGWTVIASARSSEGLNALATEVPGIVPWPLDVTDHAAVAAAVAGIEAAHGPLDLAVLNAGTHIPMGAADFSAATVRRLLEVNTLGAVNGLDALLPRMRERRAGQIAVVASVAGYRGLPYAAAYAASKAAVIALCESLRPDLERDGVILQVINPGFVDTPLTERNDFPMPDIITAQDAAAAIVRGLSGTRFEIAFPRRFAFGMKVLRSLPYGVFFAITKRMLRP